MANTENCPKVGIVMGSDSDMPVMAKAADILEELGIPYEMTVISAHREPDVFFEYAKSAEEKGFKVHREQILFNSQEDITNYDKYTEFITQRIVKMSESLINSSSANTVAI